MPHAKAFSASERATSGGNSFEECTLDQPRLFCFACRPDGDRWIENMPSFLARPQFEDDEQPMLDKVPWIAPDKEWKELQRRRRLVRTIHALAESAHDEGYHSSARVLREAAEEVLLKLLASSMERVTSSVSQSDLGSAAPPIPSDPSELNILKHRLPLRSQRARSVGTDPLGELSKLAAEMKRPGAR
jgi:hypothetical protein